MTRRRIRTSALCALAVLLLAWEVGVRAAGTEDSWPFPSGIVRSGAMLVADGSLLVALAGSLQRVLIGFLIGALVGIPLGIAMGLMPSFNLAMRPVTESLRSIAPIAWIPLAILWLGVQGNAALFVVAYSAVFPFILNAAQATRAVDRSHIRAAQALGARRTLTLRAVVLPSTLPTLFTAARIALAIAWSSIIAAELALGVKVEGGGRNVAGLGQLMVATLYVRRDVNALVVGMLVIGFVSYLIDAVLRRARDALLPWARR